TALVWQRDHWDVSMRDADGVERVEAFDVVVSGLGQLNRPYVPDLPGLDTFAGTTFHSARWDDGYPLEGKTLAVIGTGASAIQIVPNIVDRVGRLHVFQRTAPWVTPKPDRAITPTERAVFRAVPAVQKLERVGVYWLRELLAAGFVWDPRLLRPLEHLARRHLARSVQDPVLRAKLTPNYRLGCKRVLPSNDFYPALVRPHAELVTDRIREVRPHVIVTDDGVERPVDVIVCATGFEAAEANAPFEIKGSDGRDLTDSWRDGLEAYLGTSISGFPNLFLIVGPNTGLGHTSMVFMMESQFAYVVSCVKQMRANRWRSVDVRPYVQADYNAEIQGRLAKTLWNSGCASWYRTRSGRDTTLWPGFTFEFRLRTRAFDPSRYCIATG
ncbi:MAG: NAD(P)/FAD-dependent oxidoreductase, partial [Deltaproteobacteria bacterium]